MALAADALSHLTQRSLVQVRVNVQGLIPLVQKQTKDDCKNVSVIEEIQVSHTCRPAKVSLQLRRLTL